MFGGTIHKIKVDGGGTHYSNKLNGRYIDLSREQFGLYNILVNYVTNQKIARKYCGRNKNTLGRYKQLKSNIIRYLRR